MIGDLDVVTGFASLRLGHADGRHLGVGVDDERDRPVVDGRRLPGGDVRDRGDALGEAGVGELRCAGNDVTHGVDVGVAGAHRGELDLHVPTVQPDRRVLEADVRRDRRPADRDEHHVDLRCGVTRRHHDAGIAELGRAHRRPRGDLDAELAEVTRQNLHGCRVRSREDLV